MFPEKMAKDYVTVFKTERELYPLSLFRNFIFSFAPTPLEQPLHLFLVGIPTTPSKLFSLAIPVFKIYLS